MHYSIQLADNQLPARSKMAYGGERTSYSLVKVAKSPLLACFTCPLCDNLFREATTISECLHTFCEECIHEWLNDEISNCPICNVCLGCLPLEKLRADNQLREVKAKLFPVVSRKRSMSSNEPPASAPLRRKERSLSSLGLISTVSIPESTSSMEEKFPSSKDPPSKDISIKKGHDDQGEQGLTNLRSTRDDAVELGQGRRHNKIEGNIWDITKSIKSEDKQTASASGGLFHNMGVVRHHFHKNSRSSSGIKHAQPQNGSNRPLEETDLPPLAYLAEVAEADAYRSTTSRHSNSLILSREPIGKELAKGEMKFQISKSEQTNLWKSAGFGGTSPLQETKDVRKPNSQSVGKLSDHLPSTIRAKSKALQNGVRSEAGKLCFAMGSEKKCTDVWFALKASENQTEDYALQQILTPYIRIKDGKLPVSFVKKYLARKLDLTSETEVELTCRGQPVVSSLPVERVQKIWFATISAAESLRPNEKDCIMANCKANQIDSYKDLVMVLTYQRNHKAQVSHPYRP